MSKWPRDAYADAVWRSDLKPTPRLVALAYARSAGSSNPPRAWLTYEQLAAVTGAARSTLALTVRHLIEQGWLEQVTWPRGRLAPHYLLTQPSGSRTVEQSGSRTVGDGQPSDPWLQQSDSRTQPSDYRTTTVRNPDPRSTSLGVEVGSRSTAAPTTSDRGASTSTSRSDHGCTDGWADEDAARPCLACKPHLASWAAS